MIHHDDGRIEIERVDLVQPLQKENVQHAQLAEVSEQFLPEIEDEGSDIADTDDGLASLHYQKVEKAKSSGRSKV